MDCGAIPTTRLPQAGNFSTDFAIVSTVSPKFWGTSPSTRGTVLLKCSWWASSNWNHDSSMRIIRIMSSSKLSVLRECVARQSWLSHSSESQTIDNHLAIILVISDMENWVKNVLGDSQPLRYVLRSAKNQVRWTYECHRSGTYESCATGNRNVKKSYKISTRCTSQIVSVNGLCNIVYIYDLCPLQ